MDAWRYLMVVLEIVNWCTGDIFDETLIYMMDFPDIKRVSLTYIMRFLDIYDGFPGDI